MKLLREAKVTFAGEDLFGDSAIFELRYDNMGEPYREGATIRIERGGRDGTSVFLEADELVRLHECLGKMLQRADR